MFDSSYKNDPFSAKQREFILNSTATLNLAHGAVRSGKTYSTLYRWGDFCISCPDSDLIMIGFSMETIYYNAILPFMEMFDGYCTWSSGTHILKFADKNIRCMGANDQGAVGKIQGPTLSGAYVDEMTLLPSNFVDMLISRLSRPHSKLFATMNPDGPLHPIKTNLIDKSNGTDVYSLHFNLEDNPDLPEKYKAFIKQLYSGLWYKRYILGEWCMAEGAIYDFFDRKYHTRPSAPHYAEFYIVGIDYGTTNPFAMEIIGVNQNPNYSPTLWVEKEYYWDSRKMGRQKTDSELADDMERELFGLPIRAIYIDPSAASLEVELKKRGKPVKHAENDVLSGIRTVGNFIGQGDLIICQQAQQLIKEIEGYVWDPKKVKLGEDAPLKQNDHACVSGDTLILTLDGYKKMRDIVYAASSSTLINFNQKTQVIEQDVYYNAALTRKSTEVYELELEDGSILVATGDHKIMTERGMIELQQLTLCDMVLTCNTNTIMEKNVVVTRKIKKIERKGKQDVYCLAALQNGTMIANGMIVSNCDALRYAIYTHFGKRTTLKQPSPFEAARDAEQRRYQQNPMRYPGFTDSHGWQQFGGGFNGPPGRRG